LILYSYSYCPFAFKKKELLRRQKDISKGKLSNAYQSYTTTIAR
jgi:hypothetical protein